MHDLLVLFQSGLRVLGVVENMSDIRIPFNSLGNPLSGINLLDRAGNDVTQAMLERYSHMFMFAFLSLCTVPQLRV